VIGHKLELRDKSYKETIKAGTKPINGTSAAMRQRPVNAQPSHIWRMR